MMTKLSDSFPRPTNGNTRLRFEQWVKNPTCEANAISVVRNVKMERVAHAEGIAPSFGQSPFAIARGDAFERQLFYDNGATIIEKLREANLLLVDAPVVFHDLRLKRQGGSRIATLPEAIEDTATLLARLEKSSPPMVLAAPTLKIARGVMLPEAILIIDALVVRPRADGMVELVVGEVKVYPDRGGYTNAEELAVARAQAGVYVYGLALEIARQGLEASIEVAEHGFLVLSRPGTNRPSIRANEDLRYQKARAARGFALLEEVAAAMPSDLWAELDNAPPEVLVDAVRRANTDYRESCLSFCDLAPRCHAVALTSGRAVVLGDLTNRLLGDVSIHRALGIIEGTIEPSSETERDLRARFVRREVGP